MPAREQKNPVILPNYEFLKGLSIAEGLKLKRTIIREVFIKLGFKGCKIVDIDFRIIEIDCISGIGESFEESQ